MIQNSQNGSKTTQKPRKDGNDQLKYDLAVLFSLKFIFNPDEWVTRVHNMIYIIMHIISESSIIISSIISISIISIIVTLIHTHKKMYYGNWGK